MGRWIEANVARGASIAIERGAFTMGHVIDSKCYQMRELELSTLFEARKQFLCRTTAELLEARLGAAQYVAITDVNRLIHLSSAPRDLTCRDVLLPASHRRQPWISAHPEDKDLS
jgi:hypothetical protein